METTAATELDMSRFPTDAQCIMAIQGWESRIATSRRAIDQRSENYYNCLDDYSMGGRCDEAAYQNIQECSAHIDVIREQMERKAPATEQFRRLVLCYLASGKVASDRTVNTRYGTCWVIERPGDSAVFVSDSRRATTYTKKGYKLMVVVETVEYYYTLKEYKGSLICQSVILDSRMEKPTATDLENTPSRKNPLVYFARNNQKPAQ